MQCKVVYSQYQFSQAGPSAAPSLGAVTCFMDGDDDDDELQFV